MAQHHDQADVECIGEDSLIVAMTGSESSSNHHASHLALPDMSQSSKTGIKNTIDSPKTQSNNIYDKNSDNNNHSKQHQRRRSLLLSFLIVLVGLIVGAAFLALGVTGAQQESQIEFEKEADELTTAIEATWQEYSLVCLWAHHTCHASGHLFHDSDEEAHEDEEQPFGFCSQQDYSELYQYVTSGGMEFQALTWIPNITHAERPKLEEHSRLFFEERFPGFDYQGIMQWNDTSAASISSYTLMPRTDQSFYLPMHYMLPAEGLNSVLTDFDLYSSLPHRAAIDKAFQTLKPTVTRRFRSFHDDLSYSVAFLHPGIEVEEEPCHAKPSELSSVMMPVSTLLLRSIRSQRERLEVYVFDTTIDHDINASPEPEFLVGARINAQRNSSQMVLDLLPVTAFSTVHNSHSLIRKNEIEVADRRVSVGNPSRHVKRANGVSSFLRGCPFTHAAIACFTLVDCCCG